MGKEKITELLVMALSSFIEFLLCSRNIAYLTSNCFLMKVSRDILRCYCPSLAVEKTALKYRKLTSTYRNRKVVKSTSEVSLD